MSAAAPIFSWVFLLALGGGLGLPLGVPPLAEDPALARIAPQECLAYFASAGMATADPKSRNHTEQLFAEPEIHRLAAELERLIRSQLTEHTKRQGQEASALAGDGVTLGKALLTRPLAIYLAQLKIEPQAFPDIRAGAIVNLGKDADKLKAALERCRAAIPEGKVKDVDIDGATYHSVRLQPEAPEITWGVKGEYLYAAVGPGELEAMVKRTRPAAPPWLKTLRQQLPVERLSTISMINVRALADILAPLGGPQVPRVLEATGLNGIEQLAGVSGLDATGLVSRSLVTFHGEPQGLLQLVVQKPLTAADLAIIPRDATFAMARKLDLDKAFTTVLDVVEKIEPNAAKQFRTALDSGEQALGVKLVEEVLKPLGDTWCLFDSPSEGGMFTGLTLVVTLKDAETAAATHQKLLRLWRKESRPEGTRERKPDQEHQPRIEKLSFAGKEIYVLDMPTRGFPLAPAWCLTDKHLVVALFPQAIKGYLARGPGFSSLSTLPVAGRTLADEDQALGLMYVDTRRLFDLYYPLLPFFAQLASQEMRREGVAIPLGLLPSAHAIRPHLGPSVTLMKRTAAGIEITSRQTLPGGLSLAIPPILLPAVQKVREAARRTQSMNNLKQIAIAMHSYNDAQQNFPPAYRADKDGKPLLSWRVLILPYIDQDALYRQFHLDEPWDSEHNKRLIAQIPPTYRSPGSAAGPGMTNYLTVRGPNTAFPGKDGVKFADITDGLSNTILAVEVSDPKAVPWTKPDDFPVEEKNPLDGLPGLRPRGFLAAMCDGSVRLIAIPIDPKVLKNLFLRNDGNPLPPDF